MSVPAELEGKKLEGSIWIRRMGKHRGFEWRVRKLSDTSVELEIINNTSRAHVGDRKITSMHWPMFMNLYTPKGRLDEMIVTVDKEGFVQSVVPEGSNGTVAIDEVKETVVEARPEKEPMTRMCRGPWHNRSGQGTLLPVSRFSIVKIGRYTGQLAKTCNDCRQGKRTVTSVVMEPEKPVALPVSSKPTSRWKVTIIKEVTVEVEAADYLDAGVAAGDGEIVRVEKVSVH